MKCIEMQSVYFVQMISTIGHAPATRRDHFFAEKDVHVFPLQIFPEVMSQAEGEDTSLGKKNCVVG